MKIQNFFQQVSLWSFFQPKQLSFKEHDRVFYSKFNADSEFWENFTIEQQEILGTPQFPLNEILKLKSSFNLIFDLGSGPGWLSEYLSGFGRQVFAIEPSPLANEIATRTIKSSNVTLIQEFAQDFLVSFKNRDSLSLFVSQSVLQHLSNRVVKEVLSSINSFPNAYICFAEPYSEDLRFNFGTTNIRTSDWWSKHLSAYDLHFCGENVSHYFGAKIGKKIIRKGFYGKSKMIT